MPNDYSIVRQNDDTLRLVRSLPAEHLIALLRRMSDRGGTTLGWRLDAKVVLCCPKRKLWPKPEDALVATRLMTRREAVAALASADKAVGSDETK